MLHLLKTLIFVGSLAVLLSACSSSDQNGEGSGEDRGGRKFSVVCRNEVNDCYDKATSLCPEGYLVSNRVRARRIGDDEVEYRVGIRCRYRRIIR